jgi:chemotaxis response regulator CheB
MTMSEAIDPVETVAPEGARARPELVIRAASAGGIPAIRSILAGLPQTFPVPIAVPQHRSPGGTVIAQDPVTAEHPGMPRAAISTGAVDDIRPLDEIGPMLERLASAEPNDRSREATREAL